MDTGRTILVAVIRRLLCCNVYEDTSTKIAMRIWLGNFVEFGAFFLTSLVTVFVAPSAGEGKVETFNYIPCHTGKMFGSYIHINLKNMVQLCFVWVHF